MKMRVAVLLSGRAQFSVYFGGALVRWTYEVYRHLKDIEVTVFGFPTDSGSRYPLPHESSGWYRACLAMAKIPVLSRWEEHVWLRALIGRLRHYHLVHIHNRPQWATMLRHLGYSGRIIVHLQNDHLGHWSAAMLDALEQHLDAVVVCSTYIGEQFCGKSSSIAKKTKLIFNGVNTELFYPREELREPKTIFFVGSLIPQKGVLQLVRAYERVIESHPDAKLVVGGSVTFGVERETRYVQQVRQEAESIRRRTGVEVQFTGSLHHDVQLPTWFQRATIFTCPSLFQEPFGLVNAEAMACATAVVGTNRGGVPEVIGGGGVAIDPENAEEYAATLSNLLSDPVECARLGRIGLKRSSEVFDWRVVANSWHDFLDAIFRA